MLMINYVHVSLSTMSEFRVEHDSMGEVQVPAAALWRAQTQRAVENFPLSGMPIDHQLVSALGSIKSAAARVNKELGVIDSDIADAVATAATEVARGEHDGQFTLV